MNKETILNAYIEALVDTDREKALELVLDGINSGMSAEEIVFDMVVPAIDKTSEMMEEEFGLCLAQHFLVAQISSDVVEQMLPLFTTTPQSAGTVIIGTAAGDLHSLGKRLVIGTLRAKMVEVFDLGVNVSAEEFVDQAVAHNAQVIAISSMMMHTARGENGALKVRKLLTDRGLDKIKLIVGGAPFRFNPDMYHHVQADAWAPDAITASQVIIALINEVKA